MTFGDVRHLIISRVQPLHCFLWTFYRINIPESTTFKLRQTNTCEH